MKLPALALSLALVLPLVAAGDYDNPSCDGKQVIVHLFEWKWSDVALECERYLSGYGFCGVQVSPPMEHIVITEGSSDPAYTWWERYQPVSYILGSRSGDRDEFIDMVHRCNAVGVRIFIDAVVNHMAGLGRTGTGSAGSSFDSSAFSFPGVPYDSSDFTPSSMCPSSDGNVNNYDDPNEVRNCDLVGLTDLYGATDDVRTKVSDYFSDVVGIGVAGFRVDAAKHMWPDDLGAMEDKTIDLPTDQGFPSGSRPFFYLEVDDEGTGAVTVQDYYGKGRPTEFRYCTKIKDGINDFTQLWDVYDAGWNMADTDHALIFVDNHDKQRNGGTITFNDAKDHKLAVAFTLAQPYGFTRIMSSYYFSSSDDGPPANDDHSTADVIINDDGSCGGGWVCEHRWPSIGKMARFRNAVAGATDQENKYNDGNIIGFSRGNLGFFAMIKSGTFSQSMQTGMPAGTYKELITCDDITVGDDGTATVSVSNEDEPVFAICQGCSCDDSSGSTSNPSTGGSGTTSASGTTSGGSGTTASAGPTEPSVTNGTSRTVIFIHKETQDGQDLFIRGGIDSSERTGCSSSDASSDPCAIDISTNSLGTSDHYDKYNAWRDGDNKLDWFGAESGQGEYNGEAASGSPLAWTTSDSSNDGYQPLNTYGDHYWMLDMDMDCSQTKDGWFEVKAYLTNDGDGWEGDISQAGSCGGTAGGSKPYTTANHFGRCGFLNTFDFDSDSCTIDTIA